MAEVTALPGVAPVDADAAELLAEWRALEPRIKSGEIRAMLAILVITDPTDEMADEDVEEFRAGYFVDDTKVICGMEAMRLDLLEEWREERED